MERVLNYIADKDCKLEDFLKERGYSSRICNLLKKQEGLVMVNNSPTFVVAQIKKGDEIQVKIVENPLKIDPFCYNVDIIFEDEDIAVINKGADIAVIATNAHYGKSLMNALAYKWGDFVFHPVNRLDKGTSGLMIVAKHQLSHCILSAQIAEDKEREEKNVKREYLAIVHNTASHILTGEGEVIADIGQPYEDSMLRGVMQEGGKFSKTSYKVLASNKKASLVRLVLATGRTHQIRVHMSHIGHPLFGDDLYGGEKALIDRPALHSESISFCHPITKKDMKFVAPMPNDMRKTLEKLNLLEN